MNLKSLNVVPWPNDFTSKAVELVLWIVYELYGQGVADEYLYSLSWRIPTGSKPWGFWIGVIRFCFCCIWTMGDACCPGGWGATEPPGIGPVGTATAWGCAGDGRPLEPGVRCFWALAWLSPPGPGAQRQSRILGQLLLGQVSSAPLNKYQHFIPFLRQVF